MASLYFAFLWLTFSWHSCPKPLELIATWQRHSHGSHFRLKPDSVSLTNSKAAGPKVTVMIVESCQAVLWGKFLERRWCDSAAVGWDEVLLEINARDVTEAAAWLCRAGCHCPALLWCCQIITVPGSCGKFNSSGVHNYSLLMHMSRSERFPSSRWGFKTEQ